MEEDLEGHLQIHGEIKATKKKWLDNDNQRLIFFFHSKNTGKLSLFVLAKKKISNNNLRL